MKHYIKHYVCAFAIAFTFCFIVNRCGSQGFHLAQATNNTIRQTKAGDPLNGIHGEVTVKWPGDQWQLAEVSVFVVDANATADHPQQGSTNAGNVHFFGENKTETNWSEIMMNRLTSNDWTYFGPTNGFCGPLVLRDNQSRTVPALKAAVASTDAYPKFFSIQGVSDSRIHESHTVSRLPFPSPIMQPRTELASFRIADYFNVKDSVNYQLTVWPVIYKRSSTNSDLCERIDLPPVAIDIKFEGKPPK